jgi:hypothetical protein
MGADYTVPAEGIIEYKYFFVKTGFTEDRWLKASEIHPGAKSVVHHVNVYLIDPSTEEKLTWFDKMAAQKLYGVTNEETLKMLIQLYGRFGEKKANIVGTFVPGAEPLNFPDDVGFRIPAGSTLVFELHYTVNGKVTTDRSKIGIKFHQNPPEKEAITYHFGATHFINIPAGAPEHVMTQVMQFKEPVELINLRPHLHMRGKWFKYDVVYPDGRKERILTVPKWDFNWQWFYNFETPIQLPAGSKLIETAAWDNSADNPYNPNPKIDVKFGLESDREMFFGYPTYTVRRTH